MMPGQPGGPPPHHHYGPPPPHSAGPPPTPGPYPYHYQYDSGQQRRKPVRAAQACDSCRQRKAKCDEGRPECQHCKDNGLKCAYRDIPPQKSEKQVLAITERLESLSQNVENLLTAQEKQDAHNQAQDDKIQQVLNLLKGQHRQPAFSNYTDEAQNNNYDYTASRPRLVHLKSEDSQVQLSHAAPEASQQRNETRLEEEEGTTFAMPPKHTTAVHNLFEWPSIRALLPRHQSTSYVMDLEVSRGLLRFYGCGEGEDKGDGHEGAPSPANSSSSEGKRTDEETSSASPHGVWGNGQLPTPQSSGEGHTAREHPGGLSPNGGLMLDSQAVDAYFRAYMDNMHILHPFLEPKVLRQMVHTFKKKHSWDFGAKHATVGAKRKREATDSPTPADEMDTGHQHRNMYARSGNHAAHTANIEHSVANAIVLLVIALGKICVHRLPIPGPASTSSMHTSTPHTLHSTLSDLPFPKSAPSSPFSNQLHLNGTGAIVVSSPSNPQGKNMDVIPGLSYFAVAADILGELPGGVDVSHIQANLLAGLYMGQLARILPSHYYIAVACRACQILIESTDYKSRVMREARRNLINFAFWSCLQLESDILAEVELPPSGITRYESTQHAEIPTGVTLDQAPDATGQQDILRFYSYQIQLRRTMNEVHSALYKKPLSRQLKTPTMQVIEILNTNIDAWRTMLSDWDWDDDDHQSENINVARMRAKYYGAKYIIHRPVLYYALRTAVPSSTPGSKQSDSPEPAGAFASPLQHTYSPSGQGRRGSEMGPPGRITGVRLEDKIVAASKECVQAAIRSTTAFDKVPRRLIITNIFGTAHA
jgi:Fungal Zn(2)-Cys(6) binuclear cluster domain